MSDTPKIKPKPQSAKDAKKGKTFLLCVDPQSQVWYRVARTDLVSLFMEGVLPTPLLAAVDRLQDLRASLHQGVNDVEALNTLKQEDIDNMLELMRRVAVRTVIEPKMTHDKGEADSNSDVVFVGDISKVYLIEVWKAARREAGIITMSDDEADEFRTRESQSHAAAVSSGPAVQPETVRMDSDAGRDSGSDREKQVEIYTESGRVDVH